MKNSAFMRWIASEVGRRLPGITLASSKTEMLTELCCHCGATAVFEVGLGLEGLEASPVLEALTAGDSPHIVLDQWMRLERFSHTHNRTKILSKQGIGLGGTLLLEHYALQSAPIHPVNDLFLWGAIVGLMRRAGFALVRVETEGATILLEQGVPTRRDELPQKGERVLLVWDSFERSRTHPPSSEFLPGGGLGKRIAQVVGADCARSWRLSDVARKMHLSVRSVQRVLQQEGTTFSSTLVATRLAKALELMKGASMDLTEVAFCTGFSDLAHFSRMARRHYQLAPSELRTLLVPERALVPK